MSILSLRTLKLRGKVTVNKLQSQDGNQVCQVPKSAEGAVMAGKFGDARNGHLTPLTWTHPRVRVGLAKYMGVMGRIRITGLE